MTHPPAQVRTNPGRGSLDRRRHSASTTTVSTHDRQDTNTRYGRPHQDAAAVEDICAQGGGGTGGGRDFVGKQYYRSEDNGLPMGSKWTQPMDTANGHSRWIANELPLDSQWAANGQPLDTVNGQPMVSQWTQAMDSQRTANGQSLDNQRTTESQWEANRQPKNRLWTANIQPMSTVDSQRTRQWAQPTDTSNTQPTDRANEHTQ